jgi:hypothetical protein
MTDAEAAAHRARIIDRVRLKSRTKKCVDTGMPAEVVPLCVEGLMAGASMEEIIKRLEQEGASREEAETVVVEAEIAEVEAEEAAARKKKLLIYGGVGAAGLVALFLITRKKR